MLIPCDMNWEVVWDNWSSLLPESQFEPSCWGRRWTGGGTGRFADVDSVGDRMVRLVVTADGGDDPAWVAAGVVDAIETLPEALRTLPGRVKPLVALPLVGTGAGGFRYTRGALIRALLPALQRVAERAEVDVALVLRDDRDHAAIQGQRSSTDWGDFNEKHLTKADELGRRAANHELSLFLGSGVGVPLGLPSWEGLLTDIAGSSLPGYSPEKAPSIAQELRVRIGAEKFDADLARTFDVSGCAPAHFLLAGLGVRQNLTTNYDTAYERALDASIGAGAYRVLTRQPAEQPHPWLLKIHGDVRRPETIVLTSDDYAELERDHGALMAVVESLLMTSHLLFVGYSMGDPDFVRAAERVRTVRALAESDQADDLATVLALHPSAVMERAGFTTVPMLPGPDDKQAARRLEMFLDRVSWAAARDGRRSHGYLLDPDYTDLFSDDRETRRLREVLQHLVQLAENDPARRSSGWRVVEHMLTELGARARVSEVPAGSDQSSY